MDGTSTDKIHFDVNTRHAFDSLLIALGLGSLALRDETLPLSIVTPTLLLTVLECVLETRIVDVPDEYRASEDRSKRTHVAHALVKAIRHVVERLERRRQPDDAKGAAAVPIVDENDARGIVNGDERAIANVVESLLTIATTLGVLVADRRPRPPDEDGSRSRLATATRRPLPRSPRDPSTLSSRSSVSSSSATSRTTSSQPTMVTNRDVSVSKRPSLVSELERNTSSGAGGAGHSLPLLSPPPIMPGSPRRRRDRLVVVPNEPGSTAAAAVVKDGAGWSRSRSTLEIILMRQRRKDSEEAVGDRGGADDEEDDVFSDFQSRTRTVRPTTEVDSLEGAATVKQKTQEKSTKRQGPEKIPSASRKPSRKGEARAASDGSKRGEEEEGDSGGSESVSDDATTCPNCRPREATGIDPGYSTSHSSRSSSGHTRSTSNRSSIRHLAETRRTGDAGWTRRDTDCRQCQLVDRAGEDTNGDEVSAASPRRPGVQTRRRGIRRVAGGEGQGGGTSRETCLGSNRPLDEHEELDSSSSSLPARRVRVSRRQEAGIDPMTAPAAVARGAERDLSVHGKSEIERFERSRSQLDHSPSRSEARRQEGGGEKPRDDTRRLDRLPADAAAEAADTTTQSMSRTRSPYTMLLLAQRARLAEKLRALELRERDRDEAREARQKSLSVPPVA
ncbi:hypothetical protein JCM3766R1_004681 [Sporobolomyces carnicolor]